MNRLISMIVFFVVYQLAKWINPEMDWHFVIGAVMGSVHEYIKWDLKTKDRAR